MLKNMKAGKKQYSKGDIVGYDGKEREILSVRDGRDYSDQFRPDLSDGLEYEIIDDAGDKIFLNWWDFEK